MKTLNSKHLKTNSSMQDKNLFSFKKSTDKYNLA